ncbi:MAG: alpha-L-fucosidase [Thermomicrobiales bacterium]
MPSTPSATTMPPAPPTLIATSPLPRLPPRPGPRLLTNYGPIDIIWYDFSYPGRPGGGKGRDDLGSVELARLTRESSPPTSSSTTAWTSRQRRSLTPEQYQPRAWMERDGQRVTWEACQTLNGSWGYDRDNLDWKSPELLVRLLIDTVAKGGNLCSTSAPPGAANSTPAPARPSPPSANGSASTAAPSTAPPPATSPHRPTAASPGAATASTSTSSPGPSATSTSTASPTASNTPNSSTTPPKSKCSPSTPTPAPRTPTCPAPLLHPTLELPIHPPAVTIPVIELFLKD